MDPRSVYVHQFGGAAVKMSAWIETKDIRSLNTGGQLMESRKGDLVVCVVVERWDDAEKALDAAKALLARKEP